MTRSPLLLLATLTLAGTTALAQNSIALQDEIIVTASRIEQPRLQIGSAIDVLSTADIQARQKTFVSDLLRDMPGLAVSRSGPAGAFTQVRLRGAEAAHTLVVIDGIEVGDPFTAGEFEFAHLSSAGVSRVEVLRGPQSALWGSDAIGGVINVSTAPVRDDDGAWGRGLVEGGSFGTARGQAEAGSKNSWGAVRGSVGYTDIRGISSSPTGPERDGYENFTAAVNADVNVNETVSLSFALRHVDATTDEDEQDFDFLSPTQGLVIDADQTRDSKRWYGRASADLATMDGRWIHRLSAGLTDTSNDTITEGVFSFGSDGQKWDFEYQTDFTFDTGDSLTHAVSGLVEYEDLTFENFSAGGGPENQRQTSSQWSGALHYRLGLSDQVFLSAAARHDDNARFKNETTYRLTAAWAVPDTGLKVRGSYGTGVAQPTFFELFGFNPDFFIGNPGLQPETSKGWDVGIDYAFADGRGLAALTYFDANLKDEIFTVFTVFPFTVANRPGTSTRDGLETSFRFSPLDGVQLSAAYTFIDAKDDAGAREVRRPKHAGSVHTTYRFLDNRALVDLGLTYNGKMRDNEFIFATPETVVTLEDYVLGSVAASYAVTEHVELVGRLENAFNEDYQEVFGFAAPGLGVYAGVRVSLGGG